MFWKRWKEGDPLPRSFRSARWRSILVVLLAAGFVAMNYEMMHAGETKDASAARNYWTGLFWIVIGSISFLAFLPSVFRPTRVTMDSEGFTVRNFWRGEQRYLWKDIALFDIAGPLSYPYVAWVYKVDDGNLSRRNRGFDKKLPSALWTHRTITQFEILDRWLEDYNERQEKRR